MVRFLAPPSRRAPMSSIGWPAFPKPPISTVEPSSILATASAAVSTIFVISFPLLRGVFVLDHHGNTLAYTDTQCSQTPTAVFSFQTACQRTQYAGAGRAQWVTQGDCTAPGVDALVVQGDTPRVPVRQHVGGEGFVEFAGTDLIPGDSCTFQSQVGGWNRRFADELRFVRGDTARRHAHQWIGSQRVRSAFGTQEHDAGAVVHR